MVEYYFVTNNRISTNYRTPKGNVYTMYRGQPFIVTDKEDIAFFDSERMSKRFVRASRKVRKQQEQAKEDGKLDVFLDKIEGLSKTSKRKVLDKFGTLSFLKSQVGQNWKVLNDLPESQQVALCEALGIGLKEEAFKND